MVTKSENTVEENLIRRSHKRKDVKETGADATFCKQSKTRHGDESFPLDQYALKSNVEKKYKDLGMENTHKLGFIKSSIRLCSFP